MNDQMGEALGIAVQERNIQEKGEMMGDYQFWLVMKSSMSQLGGDGFDRRTLWRALEIASGEKPYMIISKKIAALDSGPE